MLRNKILKTAFSKNPSTFDPRKCGDAVSSAVIFLLFKGLTRLQANRKIALDLAESYYISSNEKYYIFDLGEHFWSDGKPITALDCELSWKQTLTPDFQSFSAHLLYPIKNAAKAKRGEISVSKIGVHAESEYKLVIELERPTPHFLELVSFCSFFPIPIHAKKQFSRFPDESFVSNGPFKLAKWKPNNKLLLKKNSLSRNKFPVHLDQIEIKILADEKKSYSDFQNKKLDWLGEPLSSFPINHLPLCSAEWKIHPMGGLTLCFFNTRVFPFTNRDIRQAFSLAIQRERALAKLNIPYVQPAMGLVPPILKRNKRKDFFTDGDIWLAKKLFQKGLKELNSTARQLNIVLTFESSENAIQMARCLKQFWEEAFSIRITLEPLEFKIFYDRLSNKQHMASLSQWVAQYTSPMNLLERFQDLDNGKNFSCWENLKFKRLLDRYLKQKNFDKSIDLVEQAEAVLFEDMPIAPISYFSFSYLKHSHLENLLFSPVGRVYLEEARINKHLLENESNELSESIQISI